MVVSSNCHQPRLYVSSEDRADRPCLADSCRR